MLRIESIKKPIEQEIELFEEKFRISMKSSTAILDRITNYIIKRKGKQIRPMFVFFSAKACGGITESTYRGAVLVELLHTASLVHDDVVDNAYERRGFFSINALWKNKIAVLVGDYLLARGLLLSLRHQDFALLQIVSDAVQQMSEGELLQIEKVRRLDISEEIYYEVIRKKTASLIASCCSAGACSAGASNETIEKMRLFGEKIGIAFQIKDDLLDFGYEDIGKPRGIDIKEKKITLPLIYALNNAPRKERNQIINFVKHHNQEKEKVQDIIRFVHEKGGMDYAVKQMGYYQEEAFAILKTLPASDAIRSLEELVRFTTDRKK